MDNFLYAVRLFGFTYFTDKTNLKRVPFLLLNWVVTITVSVYLWNIATTSGDLLEIVIAAAIFLGVLALIFGRSALMRHLQIKKRKYLYGIWKSDYGLKSYSDYDKDSSKFIDITWNGLKAKHIQMQGDAGSYSLSNIRSLKATIENMNKTLPSSGYKWVLDFGLLRVGTIDARVVPSDSIEYAKFEIRTRVCEMSQNILTHGDLPIISFEGAQFSERNLSFEALLLVHDEGQHFTKSTLENFEVTFGQYFNAPSGMRWHASQANGAVTLKKKKGLLSDSELELIQEAREREARYASWDTPKEETN